MANKKIKTSEHTLNVIGYTEGDVKEFLIAFGYNEEEQTEEEFCLSVWNIQL